MLEERPFYILAKETQQERVHAAIARHVIRSRLPPGLFRPQPPGTLHKAERKEFVGNFPGALLHFTAGELPADLQQIIPLARQTMTLTAGPESMTQADRIGSLERHMLKFGLLKFLCRCEEIESNARSAITPVGPAGFQLCRSHRPCKTMTVYRRDGSLHQRARRFLRNGAILGVFYIAKQTQ